MPCVRGVGGVFTSTNAPPTNAVTPSCIILLAAGKMNGTKNVSTRNKHHYYAALLFAEADCKSNLYSSYCRKEAIKRTTSRKGMCENLVHVILFRLLKY